MQIPHISLCCFSSLDMYKEILNNLLIVQMCIKNVQWGPKIVWWYSLCAMDPRARPTKGKTSKWILKMNRQKSRKYPCGKCHFQSPCEATKTVFAFGFFSLVTFPSGRQYCEKLNLEISCIETWQVKIHHVPRSSLIIPLSYYVKLYRVPHWFHFCHKMFSLWGRSATSTPSTSTPTTPATDGFVKAGWNVPEEGSCKVAMSSDYIVDPVTVFWGDDTVDCWWKTSG